MEEKPRTLFEKIRGERRNSERRDDSSRGVSVTTAPVDDPLAALGVRVADVAARPALRALRSGTDGNGNGAGQNSACSDEWLKKRECDRLDRAELREYHDLIGAQESSRAPQYQTTEDFALLNARERWRLQGGDRSVLEVHRASGLSHETAERFDKRRAEVGKTTREQLIERQRERTTPSRGGDRW